MKKKWKKLMLTTIINNIGATKAAITPWLVVSQQLQMQREDGNPHNLLISSSHIKALDMHKKIACNIIKLLVNKVHKVKASIAILKYIQTLHVSKHGVHLQVVPQCHCTQLYHKIEAHKSVPCVYWSLASPRVKATGMIGGTAIKEKTRKPSISIYGTVSPS